MRADPVVAMELALDLAQQARVAGDRAIGAVVVDEGGAVLARRHDEVRSSRDPTAHASVLALRDAARARGSWRLLDASLVVTLEPCALCAGAALHARIERVVLGARDPAQGALGSAYHLGADPRLNHELVVTEGVMEAACRALVVD